MKALLFLVVFISSTSFAQTNIIAAKSHSTNLSNGISETDNFGEPMPYRTIEEVKYLKDDCIVEKYAVEWGDHLVEYDTICDHPFLQSGSFDIERMKMMYPEETTFKGFDKAQKSFDKRKKKRKKMKQENEQNSTGLILFLIGTCGFFLFLFVPKMNKAQA